MWDPTSGYQPKFGVWWNEKRNGDGRRIKKVVEDRKLWNEEEEVNMVVYENDEVKMVNIRNRKKKEKDKEGVKEKDHKRWKEVEWKLGNENVNKVCSI